MEYDNGTNLVKLQWDAIHAPGLVIGVFERDKDAMLYGSDKEEVIRIINALRQSKLNNEKAWVGLLKTEVRKAGNVSVNDSILSYVELQADRDLKKDSINVETVAMGNKKTTSIGTFWILNVNSEISFYLKSERDRKLLYNYINGEEEEIFLENVQWVGQLDESIFGECTGCWNTSCCRRAAEYMMGNTSMADCTDSIIARTAPYMAVLGRINTATFSDNTTKYTKDTYNTATLNYDAIAVSDAIDYVRSKLKTGRPVLIGIHYTGATNRPPNNINRATRHFMVIVGYKKEANGQESFRYYDPGRTNEIDGTSVNNKLIINRQNNRISGTYKNTQTCTLTEVIKTN
jgi:hypothetical protein